MNIFTSDAAAPNPLFGIKVYARPYPKMQVQCRCHRRRRINKKWRKRYGMKTVVAPYKLGEVLRVGASIYAYPEDIEAIKRALVTGGAS